MNTSTQHIPFAKLADMAEEKLPHDELVFSTTHVSACSSCAGKLQRLQRLIHLMRTDAAEDAPRDVFVHALNVFPQRSSLSEPSVLRRIIAALSFDSLNAAPAFGLRSGQVTSRQLLFEAEGHDLDLRFLPEGEEWVVVGQVLGSGCAGGHVELRGETGSAAAELNDLCEFKLPAVAPGTYRLHLRLEDVEVEVPQLELGE